MTSYDSLIMAMCRSALVVVLGVTVYTGIHRPMSRKQAHLCARLHLKGLVSAIIDDYDILMVA